MKNLVRVQSIDRAVAILECFSEGKTELKLSEIAGMLDINKSTVHGIINTLKFHGFINQDEVTQKYRLGVRFIEYGELVINSSSIRNIASPILDEVCEKIDETVQIAMLDGTDVIFIDKKECNKSIKTSTRIGVRFPAYITADGRIIISYLEKDKLKTYLPKSIKKITPNTETDKNKLMDKFYEIKKQGYAIDNEELIQGLTCVAAPIFDHTSCVKYSMSITAPTIRMTEEKVNEYIIILKEAAHRISCSIGYRG